MRAPSDIASTLETDIQGPTSDSVVIAAGHSVGRLATLSLFAAAFERILGLVLIAVLAALYGASSATDTYFLALAVQLTFAIALSEAFYTALILPFARPVDRARLGPGPALMFTLAVVGALTGLYVLTLVMLSPEGLGVWLAFAPILPSMTVGSVYAAWLVSERRYFLAVIRVPLATLVGLLLLTVVVAFTRETWAIALAMSCGQVAAALLLAARAEIGAAPSNVDDVRRTALTFLHAVPPVLAAALIAGPAFVLAERFLAASLAAGSVAVLAFARGISQAPVMIAFALGNGLLPAATERHRAEDHSNLLRLSTLAFRLALLASTAAAAYLVICRDQIVRITLDHGALDPSDAHDVAVLVGLFALALPGLGAMAISSKGLFAVGAQRRVAQVSVLAFAAYVPLALIFREARGTNGLAVAFVIVSLGWGTALTAVFARRLQNGRAVVRDWIVGPLVLSGGFAVGAFGASRLALPNDGLPTDIGTLVVSAIGGGGALALAILVSRGPERRIISTRLRRQGPAD